MRKAGQGLHPLLLPLPRRRDQRIVLTAESQYCAIEREVHVFREPLDDPERFLTQSVSELATHCGVSAGSIVLFCQFLGLRGLPMLRISLARELASQVLPSFHDDPTPRNGSSIFQKVFQEHVQSLDETLRLNPPETLQAAAEALHKARWIVLFSIGLSYAVAYSLYSRLRFLKLPAFIEYDSHMQLAAAAEMTRGEVAIGISMSGTTSETVECLRLAKQRGAKTICITNSINSPLALAADIAFYAAPSEVKYFQTAVASRVPQLAIADALLWAISLRRKSKALAHLERAEEHLLKRRLASRRQPRQ